MAAKLKHNFCSVKKIQYKKGEFVEVECIGPSWAPDSVYFRTVKYDCICVPLVRFVVTSAEIVYDTCPRFMLEEETS